MIEVLSIFTSVDGLSIKSKSTISEIPIANSCRTTLARLHLENREFTRFKPTNNNFVKQILKAYMNQLMRLWYLSHRWPAKAQASLRICTVLPERACASAQSRQSLRCSHTWSREVDEPSTKNQTSSPTRWLCMRFWRMILRTTKSTIISQDGPCYHYNYDYHIMNAEIVSHLQQIMITDNNF